MNAKQSASRIIAAGLCTSMILGGVPTQAIAEELGIDSVQESSIVVEDPSTDDGDLNMPSADEISTSEAGDNAAAAETEELEVSDDADDGTDMEKVAEERTPAADSAPAADPESTDVAQVIAADGTVRGSYDSLNAAVDAAMDGDAVKLLRDADLTAGASVPAGIHVKLNLNRFAVQTNGHGIMVCGGLIVEGDGSIENGVVAVDKNDLHSIFYVDGGDLTINDGQYLTKSAQLITVADGLATVNGGDFRNPSEAGDLGAASGRALVMVSGSNSRFVANSGTFTADSLDSDKGIAMYGIYVANGAAVTLGGGEGANGPTVVSGYAAVGLNNTTSSPACSIKINSGYYKSGLGTDGAGKFSSVLYLSGAAQVEINGGEFVAADSSVHLISIPYKNSGTHLAIRGGVYDAENAKDVIMFGDSSASSMPGDRSVEISDGEFRGKLVTFTGSEKLKGFISGGKYTDSVPDDYCASDFKPVDNGDGTFGVVEKKVAQIGDKTYPSLAKAIDAAKDGQTVKLLKDASENVVIAEDKNVALDLNGCTLSGGTLSGKAALTNYGTVTIKDSSADELGRIIREDVGIPAYYVIDNQGTMTFESGTVYNNAGNRNGEGASLVRNAGAGKEARLLIGGGRFEQENFIVIKNDDYGVLEMTGGTIVTSKRDGNFLSSAVQNWGAATLTGGEITGAIWTSAWDSNLPAPGTVIGGSVVIDGEITADVYSDSVTTTPKVEISGGTIKNKENGFNIKTGAELVVRGGSFDAPVDPKYCADGFGPVQQPDGSFGVSTGQSYTVKHLFEKVDSDEYTEDESLAKTETLTGKIGQPTEAAAVDVKGFTAQAVTQGTIAADGSTVVEVKYDRMRHKVSFDSKGGSAAIEQTVKYGAKAEAPIQPTKEGSTFLGWYVSGTFNKFDFDTPITEDVHLVAHWVLNTYTVTLDANGGEPIDPIEMSHGYEFVEPTATRTGYTLTGWNDADGNSVTFPVTVTSDLTLTAQWQLDAPIVTLTADKAEPDVHAGDTVVLTANPAHALDGVTYTYQWYKGREKIDGATEKTLEVSNKDGEYTVDVAAHHGKSTSKAITSNSITLSFEKQGVAVSFAQAEVVKHVNEVGAVFINSITLQARAIGDVSYESSDDAVATVDAKTGEVAIKGVGEAVITAKVAETETHEAAEASYYLTVTDHDAGTWKTVKPSTCTEEGEEQRVCGVCNEVLETRAIEKLAHKAVMTPAKEPACTEDGNIEYWTCETCGKLFKDAACMDEIEQADTVVKATGHKLEAVAEMPATCTEPGTKAHYACSACGELFWDKDGAKPVDEGELVIPALGHDYAEIVVEPTCTEGGYTVHECQRCGDSYTDSKTDPLGHTEKLVGALDATCTEDGYTGDKVCSVCGEVLEKGEVISATGHKDGTWKVTKEPTCTDPGERVLRCSVCGEAVRTEAIAATGHAWSEWKVTKEATCTEAGREERTCSACGKKESREIPALGHKLEAVAEVPATIDAAGTMAHYKCATCGELFLDAEGAQGVDAEGLVIDKLEAVTVTFDDCIGPKDDDVVVRIAKGGVISAADIPADPEFDGYEFVGWFLYDTVAGAWGDAFDPTAPVTSDLLVGAKWKKVDGGSGEGAPAKKPAAKPEPTPGAEDKDALVQTGDSAFAQVAAAFLAGIVAIGAGLLSRRRRSE